MFNAAVMNDDVWSTQAPKQFARVLADKRSAFGQSGHRRTTMEMPKTELTASKRSVWNAGRTVGAKRALKPKQISSGRSTALFVA